jgi:hypothetical protein
MGSFLLEPQIILIDWTRDWRLDLAALIASSTSSFGGGPLGFLRVPPPDVSFLQAYLTTPTKPLGCSMLNIGSESSRITTMWPSLIHS